MEASEIVLPPGVQDPRDITDAPDRVVIDNRTDLPNSVVEEAVQDYFVEHASLAGVQHSTFQTYANEGGLLARRQFRTPGNVIEEIKLARDLAERDDDVAAVMGEMQAVAFGEGMQNQHADEKTVALFNKLAENMGLDLAFQEMYRELLISSQINTALLFTRENIKYSLSGSDRILTESLAAPLLGVLPAENIRVIGNDLFRTAVLGFEPDSEALRRWLDEYFNPQTTPSRKAQMGREDRVSANLFTGVIEVGALDYDCPPVYGGKLYTLNPRLVKRTTYPKGSWKYPRPLLTRDFALLEAKRLLNIMDYALLQGGSNFVVVAKKGSDERPAQRAELENLERVVRTASRTGVIVGDHRLSFEIITPKLDELLNPEKRKMLGRKLAMAMLRSSEMAVEDGGSSGVQYETEIRSRVIASDRRLIARHVEAHCYEETVNRNSDQFGNGRPTIWFPKIVLQGSQYFTDYIIKLRDRGDIPRRWATEAAGFDFDAALAERKREVDNDVDEIMAPAAVPFASPDMGPQDNNTGRPPGAKDGSTPDPARPKKTISRNPGETVRAWYDEDEQAVVRCGEVTYAILDEHLETKTIGRLTAVERESVEREELIRRGPVISVPVNEGVNVTDLKAVRLRDGLSMIVGSRKGDQALMAKALVFREPEFDVRDVEETVARWGFGVIDAAPDQPIAQERQELPPVSVHVHMPGAEAAVGDATGIFDPEDIAMATVVRNALARCTFPLDTLLAQMEREAGHDTVRVEWQKLDAGVNAEIDTQGRTLAVSQRFRANTPQAELSFLNETAHLVDFFLLTDEDRKAITTIYNEGHPETPGPSWDTGTYWDQVGESFMAAFVLSYSDYMPKQDGFTYQTTPEIARKVKAIIESRLS